MNLKHCCAEKQGLVTRTNIKIRGLHSAQTGRAALALLRGLIRLLRSYNLQTTNLDFRHGRWPGTGNAMLPSSLLTRAYQAAEVIAAVNKINPSNIVPEHSFLDARGLGAHELKNLESIS
ncbi:hypothetical protein ACET3Z_017265 [Daucus carota]